MKSITRTITLSEVEILNKKNLAEPVYRTVVYTDDENDAEKVAIAEYLNKNFDTDNDRKKAKKAVFGRVVSTEIYKGEIPLGMFVQSCIDYGTFEKIEKIEG